MRRSYSRLVLDESPLLFWACTATSGTSETDLSGNSRTGTYVGTYTQAISPLVLSEPNRCVRLTTSAYLSSSYNPCTADSVRTYEGWMKRDDTLNRVIWGAGSVYMRAESGTDNIIYTTNNQTNIITFNIASGVLTRTFHYALTYNDSTKVAELFVNGVSYGSLTTAVKYTSSGNYQFSGRFGATESWIGPAGFTAIYPSILSAERIREHYLVGSAKKSMISTGSFKRFR